MGGLEVLQHTSWIDKQLLNECGSFIEHVVDEDGGVREDDAFGRGVRYVAFMPEGHVFESDLSVSADDAGEAADVFAGDGIALVGHRAGTFLAGGKELLGFADFGALKMTNSEGDLV